MPAKEIAPITVAALRALRTHGTASMTQLRTTLPDLKAKTMNNLVQMSMVVRAPFDRFSITSKGRQRLAKAEGSTYVEPATEQTSEESAANNTLVAAAAEAAPTPTHLSSKQLESLALYTLGQTSKRLTMMDIADRLGQPIALVRPVVTTLIQREKVRSTSSKPPRYYLPTADEGRPRTARSHLGGGPRDHLTRDEYTCPELQRNAGISAERFTAYALPSRVGKRLHWPDGRVTPFEDHPGLPTPHNPLPVPHRHTLKDE